MVQNQVDFTNFEKDDVPYGLHYACASTIGTLSIPRVILWARQVCVWLERSWGSINLAVELATPNAPQRNVNILPIFTRGCWSPMLWNPQQRNIGKAIGYQESFLLWNEPTLFNTPNHLPVWLGVRGQEGTWFTSCYQKWPNRASRLPYLLDAFGSWDEHDQTWHHQIWPSFTVQKLSPTTSQS